MPAVFRLDRQNPRFQDVRRRLDAAVEEETLAGPRIITITEPKRSDDLNAVMWCLLTDISRQVGWKRARWRGDRMIEAGGYVLLADHPGALRLSKEEWKDVMTAALARPRMFAGIDGGLVAIGLSTSGMSGRRMRELLALIEAFGTEKGVRFSDPPPIPDP